MIFMKAYTDAAPARSEIDASKGPLLLEFGSNTCGICSRTTPMVAEALQGHASLSHIRVEDGKGRPLGRSFRVTLWPTLVFMQDGKELARLVRPGSANVIRDALARIDQAPDEAGDSSQ
jgi:thioredoxin 1